MQLIDGNRIAAEVIAEVKAEVARLPVQPCIAFVRVGEDPASVSYVAKKNRTAAEVGITPRLTVLPADAPQAAVEAVLDALNADRDVHGILVQSPMGRQIDERAVFQRIEPRKDVDGFHPANLGRLVQDDPEAFVACTPAGILELLARSGVELPGKHVVVVGRSTIVGKPVALLCLQKRANATVTVCHSQTRDLPGVVRTADVVIAALGRPEFIRGSWLKPGVVVIDVGINRVPDAGKKAGYRLVGDVEFAAAAAVASKITPVPGGVGPMTVAMLMRNTLRAAQLAARS